ncbi:MAG: aspartate/glutamate racemase family protein [bacterium]
MKMLGLVGGTSWVSTIEYYRHINQQVNARLGGAQFAKCVIYSFNHADIQALNAVQDWDGVLDLVTVACRHLANAGAEGLVLCANTLHQVADRLRDRVDLPLIHVADATAPEIRRNGLGVVALLGTRYTMELDFYRDRLASHGVTSHIPSAADRDFIQKTIYGELTRAIFSAETKSRYLDIIECMVGEGAQGVILGCTELPLLIKQSDCVVPVFDTTAIHASAAVDFALG